VSRTGYKNIKLIRLDLIPPSRVSIGSTLMDTLDGADLYPGNTSSTSSTTME